LSTSGFVVTCTCSIEPFTGFNHKKGYPNRSNKKRKRRTKPSTIARTQVPAHLSPRSRAQIAARPTPWPRARVPSRPTPWGSDADTASPDPLGLGRKFRFARPLQGSGANAALPNQSKASSSRRPYPRSDRRSDTHIVAGHDGNYSNHPEHCNLTSFTVRPYLFYCGIPPHSKRGMGEVNQRHYLLSSLTVNMTGCSIADPTPTTPTGLGNPPQEQPYCQPYFKDRMGKLLQGRDCYSSTQQKKSPIIHVKPCLPLRL